MNWIVLGAALTISTGAAASPTPPFMLVCDGHDEVTGTTVRHLVRIHPTRSYVDGDAYVLHATPEFYQLWSSRPDAETIPANLHQFSINRLTGSFAKLSGIDDRVLEWTRPGDRGCVVTKQRF